MDLVSMVGQCDNGYACVYQNDLSWSSPTTPLPSEAHPRKVFERLFGDGGSSADRLAEMRKNASLLDWMQSDIARLQRKLGAERPQQGESSISIQYGRSSGAFRRPKPRPPIRTCPISIGPSACPQRIPTMQS